MSAIVQPSPSAAPERPGPRLAPPTKPGSSRWKVWIAVLLAAAAVALAVKLWRSSPAQQPAAVSIRTARVARGTLVETLRVAGSTAARNFVNIVAPMMRGPDSGRALILMKLVKAGMPVKKGDIIAEIDAQPIKDHVDDLSALVVQAAADVRKRQAEHAIEMENLRQTVRIAKAQVEKARLDAGASEIRSDIDRAQLKLGVEEAEATYRQVQQDLATTQARQHAEIRILELTRDRHAHHRDRHVVDITRFTMHAPMSGLAVMESIWRGGDMGQVQEGDEVDPGQPFMKVVDTAGMIVEGTINQAESELIHIGQQAEVGFDAFPSLHLKGRVQSVGALAVGGWRQNYYIRSIPVKIVLESPDARVIPDLSAFGDVVLSRQDDALIIPAEALQISGGKPVVYVRQSNGFTRREVQPGGRNNTQVAVEVGLRSGEEVALQPTP